MYASNHRSARLAAIKASTVFAVTIAIVAGLIGAFLFKKFVLDKPGKVMANEVLGAKPMREITVTAVNVTICPIQYTHYKKVKVTEEQYQEIVKKYNPTGSRVMLVGDQPLQRVPHTPIRAEEPIFEDQLDKLQMPPGIGDRVAPGKRAVIIDVPASKAMFQVGDIVDITGTLMHDAFGPNGGTTACLASGKVIARFNTIHPVCCPTPLNAPTRSATVEVTPCEFGLIELARTMGATFAISVAHRPAVSDEKVEAARPAATEGMDEECCTATMEDLERAFRIPKRPDPKENKQYVVELIKGTQYQQPYVYQNEPTGAPPMAPAPVDNPRGSPAKNSPPRKNPVSPAGGHGTSN